MSIVDIVEDKNPLSLLTIVQPVVHELEYVGLGIPSPKDLNLVCNIPIALFKTGRVARVDPENPRFGRLFSGLVGVFDGKLRLSALESAAVIPVFFCTYPTPPRPTSAVQDPGTAHFCW